MSLSAGTRLGPYEIVGTLGAGGMGDVYRARDMKLGRNVALKLLPDAFARDSQRVGRFQREAQVLASLNHPLIAQIYGLEDSFGTPALVIELIEGATLAERLSRGPLPLEDALAVARQIADALEAAHEKGIVHRDLKPGNVMVSASGTVKVLDFGLAAVAQETASGPGDGTHSPTLSIAATGIGMILGTAAYMAPEQAVGKAVDKRADIWSFGVLLWEMLTGARLFNGETISHTLADVLRAPIEFDRLPHDTPAAVRDLLRRCLDRDTRTRLRDIGEARVAIDRALTAPGGDAAPVPVPGASSRRSRVVAGVAAAAVVAAAVLAFIHFSESAPPLLPTRFQIFPPGDTAFGAAAVLSPDGRQLAFVARGPSGRPVVWIRSLDAIDARSLPGTDWAVGGPFWSPDGRFLAFAVDEIPRRLKRVDITGGPPQTIVELKSTYRGAAWSPDGVIVVAVTNVGIVRVPETGGTPVPVTQIEAGRREQHGDPFFLPGGRRFVYHRMSDVIEQNGIYLGSLDSAPEAQSGTRLIAADTGGMYVPSSGSRDGHMLFLRQGTLLAQPFDAGQARATGDAVPLAQEVGNTGSYGWFSVSPSGHLTFRGSAAAGQTRLVWFSREGKPLGQVGPAADYNYFSLSPDGRRIAASRGSPQRTWVAETSRGIFSLLTNEPENGAVISPDGRVAFTSTMSGGVGDLYWTSASGVGAPEPLLTKSPTVKHANHFSPDGRFLILDDHSPKQRQDLWILPLDRAEPERIPVPFLVTPADETFGQFSPDGRWIAYSSDESGRREVYVQGFAPGRVPAAAIGKWQISTAGGDKPRWRRDGTELYYIAGDGTLMTVPVKVGATFEPGVASPLFETRLVGFYPYDVTADGRFLMLSPAEDAAQASSPVTVVLNWQAGLIAR
jgi:Tol biopolymer transport system component